MPFMEVLPAYGRDYKSGKAMKEDWDANKDFVESTTRRYVNKEQVAGFTVIGRFKRLENITTLQKK